ncbi:PilZ domain-containing protein [Desulfovibrio sp. JC010]|uniref:PilZ domain-containing protein n=1 Tax=Desulfovibrio sp. JC010 TaxID=2593641 RepID=UPI0013D848DE|nr:PilZ domain-containing protein [Desulfovibrio sp. JC010]NDV25327.1 PilZ domain-containing protein [Desulfovibrio sp. JC010]
MNRSAERRKHTRIELGSINGFFRQCDIAASSSGRDLDITILNISTQGMKFILNSRADSSGINPDDEIFIRGCIFNDNIGFLSSQKAVTVWQEDSLYGVKFTPALDIDHTTLAEMMT